MPRPLFLPLCTEVPGRGVLGTSHTGSCIDSPQEPRGWLLRACASLGSTCIVFARECQRMLVFVVEYSCIVPSSMEVNVGQLRALRINEGLSQRELAERAGVANTSVWKLERGGSVRPATLKKIADVLGVKPMDLLREGRS